MVDAAELLGARTPMSSDLFAGLTTLALDQTITFKLYGRIVLPIDGFVFFVRSDLLSQPLFSTLITAEQLESLEQRDETQEGGDACCSFEVKGSLHYTADVRQEEAENYAANRVVFTSTEEVEPLQEIAPNAVWIGEFGSLRFAFSSLTMRYQQASLWHYSGFAIYPDVEPNIIDSVTQFSTAQVVSNSLPAWLALASYAPPWAFWGPLPPLYPSFLVPQNLRPPFAAVHIAPEGTRALASAPTIDPATSSHTQLCSDSVRITLWGARNTSSLDFIDAVLQYSMDTSAFGIMNIPVTRDEKRIQSELGVVAMKKTIDFEVSYLQNRMNDIAQQVIRSSIPSFTVLSGA